jgi:hypothetical protein
MPSIEALGTVDGYKMVFEAFLCFVAGGTAFKRTRMSFCIASHHDGEERSGLIFFLFFTTIKLFIS